MDVKRREATWKRECTTKEAALKRIKNKRVRYSDEANENPRYPRTYYALMVFLLDYFYKKVENAVLFEELPDSWTYETTYEYDEFSLDLVHIKEYKVDEDGEFRSRTDDAVYKLVTICPAAFSVDEYAKYYDVQPGTVRQWIRRGKLRTVYKEGNEWKIPELSPPPSRGYEGAQYKWIGGINNLPEEYAYLADYVIATFMQDMKDKSKYHVLLVSRATIASDEPGEIAKATNRELVLDAKEREKLELFMIAHPQIKYCGQRI